MAKPNQKALVTVTIFAALAILLFSSKTLRIMADYLYNIFLKFEGFSPVPYWDNKQWSWGYGTRVPNSVNDPNINPGGTIDRASALAQSYSHVEADKQHLEPMVTANLRPNQWAALLSFAYNLGAGNAEHLVPLINQYPSGSTELESKWNQYVYANHVVNPQLRERRAYEYSLFTS